VTLAVGLMSGTSGDGVSAALVRFENRFFKLLRYQTFPYSKKIRKKISGALGLNAREIAELDVELGEWFARAALKILGETPARKVAVVGSHGQTLYHGPNGRFPATLQIGEAAVIAEKTRISVVSDFRPQDVAAGGEGAPLIPFFDHYFFGKGPVRALQNIGGIANVTIVGRKLRGPVAFDTGPGNCLIDLAIQKMTRGKLSFDPSGKWAARGSVDRQLIERMTRHPYFKKKPPKSTGKEMFGEEFLRNYLGQLNPTVTAPVKGIDALATLTYFTALTIYQSLKRFAPAPFKEIIISGGGAKNLTLMRHLKELFAPLPVRSIEALGIPAQAKEPIAFAFFALRALRGETNHLPRITGAKRPAILGKITPYAAD
jgi:anhydro-N-acetylmuramic acid kinase